MKEIKAYRNKIDAVDKKIVELLNRRAHIASEIGKFKSRKGMSIYDPRREDEVMKKLKRANRILPEKSLRAIFTEIISASRSLEKKPVVCYLGPEGTFSHEASLALFGSSCEFTPAPGFEAVFSEVGKGLADFGVLPIENSIEGSVNISLDLLAESSLYICAEKSIPARQNLVSKCRKISSVKRLYSHPQSFNQCRKFLAKNLPNVEVAETSSTAAAAQKAARDKNSAALASLTAARIYKLGILRKSVEDFSNNITRFMVLSLKEAQKSLKGKDKTSIALTLKNRPGELHRLLGIFQKRKINLTKIVSRPLPRTAWAYLFYIDFEGHRDNKKVEACLKDVARMTEELKVFGSYPMES